MGEHSYYRNLRKITKIAGKRKTFFGEGNRRAMHGHQQHENKNQKVSQTSLECLEEPS